MQIISNSAVINGVASDMLSHREAYVQSSIGETQIDGAGVYSGHDYVTRSFRTLLHDWSDSLINDANSLRKADRAFRETDEALAWMFRH